MMDGFPWSSSACSTGPHLIPGASKVECKVMCDSRGKRHTLGWGNSTALGTWYSRACAGLARELKGIIGSVVRMFTSERVCELGFSLPRLGTSAAGNLLVCFQSP